MVDSDIVLAKTASIRRSLERIAVTTGGDPSCLDDPDKQDIFILNLQRAAQGALDLASHIVADEGWGLPATLRETFKTLEERGAIDAELSSRLGRMVGFRKLAVHDYERLDLDVLKRILTDHIEDLEAFCQAALRLVKAG